MKRIRLNKAFIYISFFLLLIISGSNAALLILIKNANFVNVFDAFELSPLFDFSIGLNCGTKSHLVFYIWKKRTEDKNENDEYTYDETNIEKINGYYFCYKHKSYRELLYNNQIRKYGENCGDNYPKDCRIIDTLNQHLCIEDNRKCPLYDVGIGERKISYEYDYNENATVYYNNDNYNEINKKIIGKLILSQGQPCYSLNEKLWRKFDKREGTEGTLECELNISDKIADDKYKYKGNITYRQLYEDNLSNEDQKIMMSHLKGNEMVSLYGREFIGIDKSCDEKYSLSKNDHEIILKYQYKARICLFVELVIIFIFISLYSKIVFDETFKNCDLGEIEPVCSIYLPIIMLALFIFIICKIIFLCGIIIHNLEYNCSDIISNEVFKKENENTKKSIFVISIDLGIELFVFLFVTLYLILYFVTKRKEEKTNTQIKNNNSHNNENINKDNYSHHNNSKSQDIMNTPVREINLLNSKIKVEQKCQENKNNDSSLISDQPPALPPN